VADPLPSTDLAALSAARERLAMLLTRVLPPEAEPPPPSMPDAEFVDLLAQYLPLDDALRQRLLELPGPLARARALIEALQERAV
jgi:hypothetical protein